MKNILLYGLLTVGGIYAWKKYEISRKRTWLLDFTTGEPVAIEAIKRMTDAEIEYVYEFLTKYAPKTESEPMKPLPTWLQLEIQKISTKYNIFT